MGVKEENDSIGNHTDMWNTKHQLKIMKRLRPFFVAFDIDFLGTALNTAGRGETHKRRKKIRRDKRKIRRDMKKIKKRQM